MKKKVKQVASVVAAVAFMILFFGSGSTKNVTTTPTLSFTQYGLKPGPVQTQDKSDILISLEVIRISDIYEYPDLFSFLASDFPQYKDNYIFKNEYPTGPLGKKWEFPFATPDGKEQLLLCWAKVRNGTDHILRMGDARVYLVVEGEEPVPAFGDPQRLFESARYFERRTNEELQVNMGPVRIDVSLPSGFYPGLVRLHRDSYKLINDLNKEILPDFTYEGLLVFPVIPTTSTKAKISFFDVTSKTDAAGNPVEKTTFNFYLVPQEVQMWFKKSEKRWNPGKPPVQ